MRVQPFGYAQGKLPRSSASPPHSPLTRSPLGGARGSRSLNDLCEFAPGCSRGYQGAEEQVEGDGRVGGLHLGDAGLAGADELGEAGLGQVSGLSSQPQSLGERESEFDELGFLLGESQELADCTNLPARCLEFLSFRALHRSPHVFVVMSQSPPAILDYDLRRSRCLLVEDLKNQNGIPVKAVDDSPGVVAIPNAKLVARRTDDWHGPGMRKIKPLALLKSPQEVSGFDSSIGREGRSLDFAL